MDRLAWHVKRLTSEPAEFWQVDAGSLALGGRGDAVVIDPAALMAWDPDATITVEYREAFDNHQMVNRSSGIVTHTVLNGHIVWADGELAPEVGKVRLGDPLLVQ
jgi:N-acyl-D-aspartate/D-glutamate deacylase